MDASSADQRSVVGLALGTDPLHDARASGRVNGAVGRRISTLRTKSPGSAGGHHRLDSRVADLNRNRSRCRKNGWLPRIAVKIELISRPSMLDRFGALLAKSQISGAALIVEDRGDQIAAGVSPCLLDADQHLSQGSALINPSAPALAAAELLSHWRTNWRTAENRPPDSACQSDFYRM